jgi:hypothetical protein
MHDYPNLKAMAFKSFNPTGNPFECFGPSSNRWGLVICPPAWGYTWFNIDAPAVVHQGIHLGAGNKPLYLNVEMHGDLVQRSWSCIGDFTDIGPSYEGVVTHATAIAEPATGAGATCTIAGVGGEYIWVTGFDGGFIDVPATSYWTLQVSAATWAVSGFTESFSKDFHRPILSTTGNNATLFVSGVAGSTLYASIRGFLTGSPSIAIVELFEPCTCQEALYAAELLAANPGSLKGAQRRSTVTPGY